MFGYNTSVPATKDVKQFNREPEPVPEPVVIQIKHQGFPFDLNGNFPYVVMIDNVVHTYRKEDVLEFINKSVPIGPGEGRTRQVSN